MVEKTLKITGLDCIDCAKGLEASILNLDSVQEAKLNYFEGILTLHGDIDDDQLHKLIKQLGYGVDEGDASIIPPEDEPNALLGFWRYIIQQVETQLALIAGVIVVLSLIINAFELPSWLVVGMQIGALALAGWPIARNGIMNLWINHTLNINFLMTVAGIGAVVIGEYPEAASLILLFDLAEGLEGFTNARARRAISGLTSLTPTHAILLNDGHESIVAVEELALADRVLIRPGERIPIDGVIIEGKSDINQAPVTGESIPVWKESGQDVYSGTVNGNGRLIIEVTRLVGDSTLHRIIEMVTEAQSRQSRSQKFIDRFAKYYTPAMVILAILMAAIPPLFFGEPFLNLQDGTQGWLHRALVLLVISCPCALVISTPVTMVASLSKAVKEGVLFKGGIFVETLSKIKAFAFDKTGTLTKGEPQVVECRDLGCQGEGACEACDDLVALSYALERYSTHPLAQAVAEEAQWRNVNTVYPPAENLIARGGLGLEGDINGDHMTIGNLRLFEEEHNIPPIVHEWVDRAESQGKTAMLLCDGEKVRGFIAVADEPRPESHRVIEAVNELGKNVIMLTGDNVTVAKAVGVKVGVDEVRANLLPGDKQTAVDQLRREFGSVAMVGDGINDAPALASADLGIAMGGTGSDQAMETADIVLMADDMGKLPFAIKLSGFANRLVKENIIFSITSKLLVAVIALFGYAPLWLAVLADMGVSLLVTLNGLRAMRFKG